MSTVRAWRHRLLLLGFSTVLCEMSLQVASHLSAAVEYHLSPPWSRNISPDSVLGVRMSPFFPGHDSRGYRNAAARAEVDLLAVGDSMTYGFAAPPSGSWPRQLAELAGQPVYNAGVGGYGPPEYEVVIDELLPMGPKIVLVGFYVGNDIAGAYKSVYLQDRFPELMSADRTVLAAMAEADANATLRDQALGAGMETGSGMREGEESMVLRWARRLALYKLARGIRFMLGQRASAPFRLFQEDSFSAAAARPGRVAFDGGVSCRTVFLNPELTALASRLDDPRIGEGLRISGQVLGSVQRKLRLGGQDLFVVLIQSKKAAYEGIVRELRPSLGEDFFEGVESEREIALAVRGMLDKQGIPYVDTLPAMISLLEADVCSYHESDDEHPNSVGYRAIAQSVWSAIEDRISSPRP